MAAEKKPPAIPPNRRVSLGLLLQVRVTGEHHLLNPPNDRILEQLSYRPRKPFLFRQRIFEECGSYDNGQESQGAAGVGTARSVLSRAERIQRLKSADRWQEGDSPMGLAKVRVYKLAIEKKKKKKEEEGAEGAEAGAAATDAAKDAPKKEAGKKEAGKKEATKK